MEYIEREAVYRFAQEQKKKETGAYSKGWNYAMDVIKFDIPFYYSFGKTVFLTREEAEAALKGESK